VTDFLYVKTPSNSIDIHAIAIYDILGRKQDISYTIQEGEMKLNISALRNGVYLLYLNIENTKFRKKIIVY
jgi:hypothetical protein